MRHNIIISTIAVLAVCPAFADIATNNATPTCDSTTIGATSGSTALDATWNANTLNLKWYADNTQYNSNTCTYGQNISIPTNAPTKTGYTFNGWKVRQQCDSTTISFLRDQANQGGTYYSFLSTLGTWSQGSNASNLQGGEFENNFPYGLVRGLSLCSTSDEEHANNPDETGNGQYCWCKITSFAPKDGEICDTTNSLWVFGYDDETYTKCANGCTYFCTNYVRNYASFRRAIYGVTQ